LRFNKFKKFIKIFIKKLAIIKKGCIFVSQLIYNTTKKLQIMKTLATEKINETTFNLAVQTYAELSNRSILEVVTEIQNGNKTLVENIIKLMFLAA
jgi:hypothetical protein